MDCIGVFSKTEVTLQAALSVKGWERLGRDELVTRACQAVAAVAHEKRRNAELVHRLQQWHEEGLEARQLKGRFQELQVPHVHILSGCLLACCLSVCLSVCLSMCLCACLSSCGKSSCLPVPVCLSVCHVYVYVSPCGDSSSGKSSWCQVLISKQQKLCHTEPHMHYRTACNMVLQTAHTELGCRSSTCVHAKFAHLLSLQNV